MMKSEIRRLKFLDFKNEKKLINETPYWQDGSADSNRFWNQVFGDPIEGNLSLF